MLMFHGNGGNYGQRLPLAKLFHQRMGCNVAMLCYRGYVISMWLFVEVWLKELIRYGDSEGEPSEKGFQLDSQVRPPSPLLSTTN